MWIAFLSMVYTQRAIAEPTGARALAAWSLAVIVLAAPLWMHVHGAADQRRYAPPASEQLMSVASWTARGWQQLPQRRREFAGEDEEPFPLQWACSEEGVRQRLAAQGWTRGPGWSLTTLIALLAPGAPLRQWPVLPRFDQGRRSSIVLTRAQPGASRQTLRLWRSDSLIAADGAPSQPLWHGTTYTERYAGPRALLVRENAATRASVERMLGMPVAATQLLPAFAQAPAQPPLLLICR